MEVKRKVLAYITRGGAEHLEILVFTQKDREEAGVQVPGGTIEQDEMVIDALYREIVEESGITPDELELVGKLKNVMYTPDSKKAKYDRFFFHLIYKGSDRNEWEHHVGGGGEDDGMVFVFKWVPIKELPELAANQGQAIMYI